MVNDLDIVITTFNVKDLLLECLKSIFDSKGNKDNWNIIVIDNASRDGTVDEVREKYPNVIIIANNENLGFGKGNNQAKNIAKAESVLFLNPDTKVVGQVIQKALKILGDKKEIAAVGCRVMLPDGKIDYSCHRGLPTVWNTFSYWSGLSKLFPKSKIFAGYTATYLDYNKSSEIDCISGTFLMIRRSVLDKIGWWDEAYFWNGEDIEMCYQIKKHGWKIWYDADGEILHFKGSSSGLRKTAAAKVPKEVSLKSAKSAAKVMNIFVRKHWKELGPAPLIALVWLGILLLEKYRLLKLKLGLKYA
jgi:GT2 family glycosyltransferase